MKHSGIFGAVPLSHLILCSLIKEGDIAVDATCGNGKDSIMLASLVGETGKVFSFDIQKCAIENASVLALESGYIDRIEFINDGHENMDCHVKSLAKGIVFNLGYLPGGDKSIITRIDSTLSALDTSIKLLADNGVISICMYTGHENGDSESIEVETFVSNLSPYQYNVWKSFQLNRSEKAPYNVYIQKI